ncbi:GntR family transcriptional regulator [Streptomyces chartreusis]|uniref:GntR family transcriptional regulator n=1 Tax=Streptomyces chartreusis TaxID=1969 RepID=UPI0033A78D50
MTGETSKQPKYRRIADDLRAKIDAGEFGPGDRLPGENPLAAEYGVAGMTARQALNALKKEGLVDSRKGAGFYVRSFRPIRRRSIARLSRDHWGSGASIFSADDSRELEVDVTLLGRLTAPPTVAFVLGLEGENTAFGRSRRFLVEDRPVLLSTSYMPYDLVAGTRIAEEDTGPGGTYARLAELGRAPVHFREEIRVRAPSAEDAISLNLSLDTPVINVVRTAYDEAKRAIEVNQMTLDSLAYVLEYEFDA